MVYLITYDLNSPASSHKEVQNAIKKVASSWCSFWKGAYLIRSGLPSGQIVEAIKPCLDDTDRLFIAESTGNFQGWLTDEQWKFVERNIYGR